MSEGVSLVRRYHSATAVRLPPATLRNSDGRGRLALAEPSKA